MDISIFPDKSYEPTLDDVKLVVGNKFSFWQNIYDYAFEQYPKAVEQWNFPGKKYGWSYRIKDKRRAILYFLPRDGFFMVAFVFGDKAMNEILVSDISTKIKDDLFAAKKYVEGRGVRFIVENESTVDDVKKLIDIKLMY